MNARLRLLLVCALAVALALTATSVAYADAFASVFRDYQSSGTVRPCAHSTAELQSAQRSIPPDIAQYAPDFPGLIASALTARERGACSAGAGAGASAAAPTPTGPAAPSAASAATQPAAPPSLVGPLISGEAAVPTWTPLEPIVLTILAVAAAIALAIVAIARLLGWTFERLVPARHELAEAAYRTRGVWGDFADWARLGR